MESALNIIQWNCCGFSAHLNEIQMLTAKYNTIALCIQETKFPFDYIPVLKNYKAFYHNVLSNTIAHGGVATYISNSFSCKEINISSNFQIVAVKIYFPVELTIINIYLPNTTNFTRVDLENIIKQIDSPFVFVGDFNSHNIIWGSEKVDKRGHIIEDFLNTNNLNLLNDTSSTHFNISSNNFSSIDLSITSPSLHTHFNWFVTEDLYGSDHFPIVIPIMHSSNLENRPKWNLKKADWRSFQNDINLIDNFENIDDIENYITTSIINSAKENIPQISFKRHKLVPWWSKQLDKLYKIKTKYFNKYKRTMSNIDLSEFKKANYDFRKQCRIQKKKSWENFVSNINSRTPTDKVFKQIRKIKGNNTHQRITSITSNSILITNPKEIANKMSEHFKQISSTSNYSIHFQNLKQKLEKHEQNIFSNSHPSECYNSKITLWELETALNSVRGSSPGPDDIHYDMLKNLNTISKKYILEFFNVILKSGKFPKKWRKSILIPILKPNKDANVPQNYRPISLTSCLCKILERILNKRLVWYLETNKILNINQSGFRKSRSTYDNLASIESVIMESFSKNNIVLSVFFDISNAYDRVWRFRIIEILQKIGIKGSLLIFIYNFLADRTFQTNIGNILSDEHKFENGIPQGSVLSVTLFLLSINDILKVLGKKCEAKLYADDLYICVSGKNMYTLQRKLQTSINEIEKWCLNTGFTISEEKTTCMLFSRKNNNNEPFLTFNNKRIKNVNEQKFLGMILDSKLTWKAHIRYIKMKSNKNLNIIKILCNTTFGSDTKLLLKVHKSLILSVIDYGSIFYDSACKTNLGILDPINNTGIRLSTGSFRSSPSISLYLISNILPLEQRRLQQSLTYYFKIKSFQDHPLSQKLENDTLFHKLSKKPKNKQPFYIRTKILMINNNIESNYQFSKQKFSKIPPWLEKVRNFDISLTKYSKENTNALTYQQLFRAKIEEYKNFYQIYTDGSCIDDKSGCAVYSDDYQCKFNLGNNTSIFTSELYAIYKAIKYIQQNKAVNNCIILTDSLSAINSLQNLYPDNYLCQKIGDLLNKTNKKIIFIWIPSHKGIKRNEIVDKLAKESLEEPHDIDFEYNYKDLQTKSKSLISKLFYRNLINTSNNKLIDILKEINFNNLYFHHTDFINYLGRKEACKLTRLRIGHTRFSHEFLMKREAPLLCSCNNTITVKHILFDCLQFENLRTKYNISKESLFKSDHYDNLVKYLKEIDYYENI